MSEIPRYDVDFYSDEFIRAPWPHYARMRELGPVVWLPQHGNYALTRHAEVRQGLRDHDTFISGRGVAASDKGNELTRGSSTGSDGERHAAIRAATSAPLLPGALKKIQPMIDAAAEGLIENLLSLGKFDAVKDFATFLPLTIVRDMVGLPDFGRENMLRWANGAFDLLGVQNVRGKAAVETFLEQRKFAQSQSDPSNLKPGSWTRRLFELVEQGDLAADLAPVAMRDYLNPSLDTTISATSQLIYQLGINPDQWVLLRAKPELARQAVNEAVRLASPVRSFARHTSREVRIGDFTIPENARVMMLYASANRDERVYPNPDKFDITRNPREHIGFGSGIHMCVGMHLAQMEMIALVEAMIPFVQEIQVGEPTIALNNTIYGLSSLPARFVRAAEPTLKAIPRVVTAPEGRRVLQGIVFGRQEVADGVISLDLAPVDGEVLPEWTPGSHVDIYVKEDLVRQYSLTGKAKPGHYQIAVQREQKSKGGSSTIFDRFHPGTRILLSCPRNHFPLSRDAKRHVLFSGGIGMTPHLAMAWHLYSAGIPFEWHISARNRARLAWASEIEKLPFRDKIRLYFDDEAQTIKAAEEMTRADRDAHFYICGPRGYMDFILNAAAGAGIEPGRVHQEHFSAEIDIDGDPFIVVAARSGKQIRVEANETILAALKREGIEVETSCRNGVCGSCLTAVLEGRPDHRDMVLTASEKAENMRVAVCCSRSKSTTLVLDL